MAKVHRILVYGDPRLEAANLPVTDFGPDLEHLVDDMFQTCIAAPGLGLAAPQIGVNLSLAVIDLSVGKNPDEKIVLANPELIDQEGKVSQEEGCLSFPGLFTTLSRPRTVRVRAQDLHGEAMELEGTELLAQAICHELDHLEGRLLVHHLRGLKKARFMRRVKKMQELGVWLV